MYRHKSLKKYLDDLAAKKPAPGGGSASALVGALGLSLLSMATNYTIGKKKYKDRESQMRKILSSTENLRKRLLELVDLDTCAYRKFYESKKKIKEIDAFLNADLRKSNADKRRFSCQDNLRPSVCNLRKSALKNISLMRAKEEFNKALKETKRIPRQIIKCCQKGFELSSILVKRGNVNLIGDVKAARTLLKAAKDAAWEFC